MLLTWSAQRRRSTTIEETNVRLDFAPQYGLVRIENNLKLNCSLQCRSNFLVCKGFQPLVRRPVFRAIDRGQQGLEFWGLSRLNRGPRTLQRKTFFGDKFLFQNKFFFRDLFLPRAGISVNSPAGKVKGHEVLGIVRGVS